MKILLIAPQPFFEKRGTPLAVAVLCRALTELGHQIDLVTYHIGEPWSCRGVNHHRALKIPFVRSVKKGLSATKLFLDIFVFFKALALLLKNSYDCIHGVEEGAMMGVLLKGLFRAKLVYDMDSSIPEQIADSGSALWSSKPLLQLAGGLEGWAVNYSDLVLAVCPALKERVEQIAPGKPVAVLEDIPVVEKAPESLEADMERLRSELGLGDAKCVVYTGTFEEYQGIDLLLDAMPLVLKAEPEAILILVGGQPEQLDAVQARVERLGISRNLRILGRRPMEEMPAFMALASVLASPRRLGTNTPMKVYSYLQSGTAVVATRLKTHTQVLNDNVAMLAEATPEGFSDGIIRMLQDRQLCDNLAKAGQRYVEANYSYEAYKNKLAHAYARLVNQ